MSRCEFARVLLLKLATQHRNRILRPLSNLLTNFRLIFAGKGYFLM